MAETVVKQLHFSPAAFTPPQQQQGFNLQPVKQRLDARPEWTSNGQAQGSAGGSGSGSKKCFTFKAPSDDEDDDVMSDDITPATVVYASPLAPQGPDSSSQGWAQQQQQQQQQQHFVFSSGPSSHQSPVESMLWEHTRKLQAYALREADTKQQQLHSQLHQVEQQLAHQLQQVQQEVARKRARAAAADEENARQRMQERHRKLQEIQLQQQALQAAHATALQEAHKQQAEAEARRKAEAAAAAAEKQRREEEARKQQAAAAAAKAAAEAQAKAAAQQQQQQQQAPAAAAAPASSNAAPAAATASSQQQQQQGSVRASAGALEYAGQLKAKLESAEASAAKLISKPELKAARRAVEKKITMWVSQISGTQQQVRDKSMQIIELIKSCSTPEEQNLAYVTLCNRMLSQCEVQVLRIGSFAFPLAYVCVAVGAAVPQFMELLLAKLQQACPLLVPQHAKRTPGASDTDFFQSLGYKLVDDPRKAGQKRLENADEYVSRMTAMVLLYASIVQTESAGNPLPLSHGWTWMARCLNSMPPNRSCATALMAFLSHAGYRMAGVYARQFHKMLQHLAHHYLPALEAKAEKDTNLRAVATRLHTYISARSYLKEPEGRTLKRVDESQTIHA